MIERFRTIRTNPPQVLGVLLVIIGLMMFAVVFFAAFPVLSDPVGTYDEWFPGDPVDEAAPMAVEEEAPEGPTAAFRYVAETTVIEAEPGEEGEEGEEAAEGAEASATYRVRFEDRSEPGDAPITSWVWDLGDGAEATRSSVTHNYEGPGAYEVLLEVEDENGEAAEVVGEIEVPEEGRGFGRIDAADDIDLSGIEAAVEDAVVALEESVEDAIDSTGDAMRNAAVVALFALAAIATTVVAWRVTRSGVMLLRPAQDVRLRVKSADMHVDIERKPLEEVVAEQPVDAESPAADREAELIEA